MLQKILLTTQKILALKVLARGKETQRICDRNLGIFQVLIFLFFYASEVINSGDTFLSVMWKTAAHFG